MCDECGNTGFVYDSEGNRELCNCAVRSTMEMYISKVPKGSPFRELPTLVGYENTLVFGSDIDTRLCVRASLLKMFPKTYTFISAYFLVDLYLGKVSSEEFASIYEFVLS